MGIRYSEQFVRGQIPLPEEYVSDRNARKVRETARRWASGGEEGREYGGGARDGRRGVELLNIVINVAFTFCARR